MKIVCLGLLKHELFNGDSTREFPAANDAAPPRQENEVVPNDIFPDACRLGCDEDSDAEPYCFHAGNIFPSNILV